MGWPLPHCGFPLWMTPYCVQTIENELHEFVKDCTSWVLHRSQGSTAHQTFKKNNYGKLTVFPTLLCSFSFSLCKNSMNGACSDFPKNGIYLKENFDVYSNPNEKPLDANHANSRAGTIIYLGRSQADGTKITKLACTTWNSILTSANMTAAVQHQVTVC